MKHRTLSHARSTLATLATLAGTAALALAGTGCAARTIISFDDHPRHPVTQLEVYASTSYLVYTENEHRFYTCTDAGDKLVCKRACGGRTDITCPTQLSTGYGSASNTR